MALQGWEEGFSVVGNHLGGEVSAQEVTAGCWSLGLRTPVQGFFRGQGEAGTGMWEVISAKLGL